MALTVGMRLGPYEIVAAIGAGGMGEVYRARDTKLGRDVALKILPELFASDPDRLARFQREAQVLASLNHPNIGAIYGLEESNPSAGSGQMPVRALVLELVDGPTLADRIAHGAIPIEDALPIAKQIAEALEAAHEQGVIHRDLKPANIKVRSDGTVKVLDFGLAKLIEDPAKAGHYVHNESEKNVRSVRLQADLTNSPTITTPAVTQMGTILGTAAYMSPEQAKGRPADNRSDVWAFGCVLFEILTGKRAFEGDDVADTLASVLKGEPDWTLFPADAPRAVRTVIRRSLVKDPRKRIGDISIVQFVLEEATNLETPDVAPVETPSPPKPRWNRAAPVAAAVLLTAGIVGGMASSLRPARMPPNIVRFSFTLPESQVFSTARQMIAISQDGTQLAYVANNRLFLRSLSELDAHAIFGSDRVEGVPGPNFSVQSPAFSPDGRAVAFWAANSLKRIPVTGGAATTICPSASPFGLTWDASGVVFGLQHQGVWRCPDTGGAPQQLATVEANQVAHGPQILLDGRALLFTIANDEGGATRWDQAQIVMQWLKSGERKTIIKGGSDARYLSTGHLLYAVGGVVFARRFDPERQALLGDAVRVLEGVGRSRGATVGTAHVATSETGALVYVPGPASAGTNQRLAIATRQGTVTPLTLPPGSYVHVRASRDGQLAVDTDDGNERNVSIANLNDSNARRLTFQGRNRFPIWSWDGRRVAFQSDREGDLGIFAQRADGSGPVERLTKAEPGEAHVPESWSPDGKHISFSVGKGSGYSLWILSVAEKKVSPFGDAHESAGLSSSVFSPDGNWIAYYSGSTATGGISDVGQLSSDIGVFIRPFPATAARYQVPKQQVDFHPVWSRDGKWLFFIPSANSARINVMPVTTEHGVAFGPVESLPARVTADRLPIEGRAWDVLTDGRFIGLVPDSGAPGSGSVGSDSQIRVVLNWFEELKQRVPTN